MRSFLHGAVQLHVLHHAAEHPIHGAWMAAELARHGYRISPGTLYPTLHRLEAAGLLSGHDDLETGRRVRRYTIRVRLS
jgi:PadR family transcriptional regulator, regulatory protein PadR